MTADRKPIEGRSAWTGAELRADESWIRRFTDEDVACIDAALANLRAKNIPWQKITRENFPLGAYAAKMADAARELEEGRGIVLLRGLPVARYSKDELRAIHFGLARHLGTPVYQSASGEMIGEITDEGAAARNRGTLKDKDGKDVFMSSRARVQTTGALRWHTDRSDVVALLCVDQSMAGGLSEIASALTIHNAMLERRPDLLEELFRDLPRSRLGEEKGGEAAHYMLPVFAFEGGHFTTHYSRTYVEAGQQVDSVPRVTPEQWEALDMLSALGHELGITHRFQPGDIQYLNNHFIYHGRTPYEDAPEGQPGGHRLLYRIWISMANSRPLPATHAVLFGDTRAGSVRGGIRQPNGSNVPPEMAEA